MIREFFADARFFMQIQVFRVQCLTKCYSSLIGSKEQIESGLLTIN